jgi:hypothetical protein
MQPLALSRRKILSVGELALLFRGEDDCEPCPHVNLVLAICDQIQPQSAHQLFCVIYGMPEEGPATAELVASVDDEVLRTIDAGYDVWASEQRQAA